MALIACQPKQESHEQAPQVSNETTKVIKPVLKSILDSAKVEGAIVLYKPASDSMFSNDFEWADVKRIPASTFKITNSIIGLETGVVENEQTSFPWDGTPRRLKMWERDFVFKEAYRYSCLPCYQEVARSVGVARMNRMLDSLGYSEPVADSTNIDLFWLNGDLKISMYEQLDFLQRIYNKQLPIAERTFNIMREIMLLEKTDEYALFGKTGWAIRNGNNNGWFVGFVETKGETWFFATNIDPESDFDMDKFAMIRKDITMKAFNKLRNCLDLVV
jgi:beta-lactamase class D